MPNMRTLPFMVQKVRRKLKATDLAKHYASDHTIYEQTNEYFFLLPFAIGLNQTKRNSNIRFEIYEYDSSYLLVETTDKNPK